MTVDLDESTQRFVVHLPDGEAELLYARPDPHTIDLQHTEVPKSARGQGVADLLAETAFAYAHEHGLRVIPSCPFIRSWLRRHPAERQILVDKLAGA